MVESNKIYRTKDYSMFKTLDGNRAVLELRVNKIIDSIKNVGYILSPLCVNEKFEIIDGQARLEAFKKLDLPVDYYVVNGAGLPECIAMNIYQTKWSLYDYISSYAQIGDESYIYLKNALDNHKSLGLDTVFYAFTERSGGGNRSWSVKDGSFFASKEDAEEAEKLLDWLEQFVPIISSVGGGKKKYYYIALAFCYNHSDIDKDRLYNQIVTRRLDLLPTANILQAVEVVERIYNLNMRKRVYLSLDYTRAIYERNSATVNRNSKKRVAESA